MWHFRVMCRNNVIQMITIRKIRIAPTPYEWDKGRKKKKITIVWIKAYKDAPELSHRRRSTDQDISVDKTLLVNPNCPVRIMLEYIRKKCRLGIFTQFDLCDETGALKGLFNLKTYEYATDQFEHKKTYYLIVIRQETDKRYSVLPQLNQEHRLYIELKARVKKYILTGELSPPVVVTPGKTTTTPPATSKKKKDAA